MRNMKKPSMKKLYQLATEYFEIPYWEKHQKEAEAEAMIIGEFLKFVFEKQSEAKWRNEKCKCIGCSSEERCTKEIRIDIMPQINTRKDL